MIREMNSQNGNGIKKPYNSTYHKNDINLNSKPIFKNTISIKGSTTSNSKRTGIDNKKITSNHGVKPENKNYTRKFATSTTTNATNVIRKSIDRASNTSQVKRNSINNNTNSNVAQNQTGSIRQYYKNAKVPNNNKVIDNQKKNSNQSTQPIKFASKPTFDSSFKKDNKAIEKENYNITEEYLCFNCQEKTFIRLDPFNLKVNMECRNGHSLNLDIAEFKSKNENNNKKITCSGCRNRDIRPKNLYYCSCGKTICRECTKNHKNHVIIQFYLKYNNCLKHKKEYTHFCQKCNKNICDQCFNEHKNHKESVIKFDSILPNKNGIITCRDYLEKKRKRNIELKNKFESYFEKLKEKANNYIQNLEQFQQLESDITAKVKNLKINNYEDIKNFEYLKSSKFENPNINEFLNIRNNFAKEGKYLIKLIGGEDFDQEEKEKQKEKEKEKQKEKEKEKEKEKIKQKEKAKYKVCQGEKFVFKQNKKIIQNKNNDENNFNKNKINNNVNTNTNIIIQKINNVKNIINHNINVKEKDKLDDKKEIKGKEEEININNINLKSDKNTNTNSISNQNYAQKEITTKKQENNIDTKKDEVKLENKITYNKIKEKESVSEVSKIIPKIPKEFRVLEKIENCELKLENRDERCITCFELLRKNRILIVFKGGIIKIYELEKNGNVLQLKELLRLEEDEYCFNYGIELKDGNLAVCSEDGTIKIIKLLFDEKVQTNEKHKIIQKMTDKNQDPLYTIKQLENEDLAVGCWKNILIYQKADKFELINKIYVNEYTFSILELTPNVIVTSHTESKSLTIHDLNNYENDVIKDIESNENNNIICKYNNKNEIVLVAYDKGINIVSIVKKCLIKKIVLNEIISGLCPIMMDSDIGGRTEKICGVLCGAKRKIYGENVNYAYSLLQIGFNLNDKDQGEIDIEKDIEYKRISVKDRVHYYDVNNLKNSLFLKNNETLTIKDDKNEQWIFSAGNEDKLLKIWKF